MKPGEEDLLCDSTVELHSRFRPGQRRGEGWRREVRKIKKELCCSLLGRVWPFFSFMITDHCSASTADQISRI